MGELRKLVLRLSRNDPTLTKLDLADHVHEPFADHVHEPFGMKPTLEQLVSCDVYFGRPSNLPRQMHYWETICLIDHRPTSSMTVR